MAPGELQSDGSGPCDETGVAGNAIQADTQQHGNGQQQLQQGQHATETQETTLSKGETEGPPRLDAVSVAALSDSLPSGVTFDPKQPVTPAWVEETMLKLEWVSKRPVEMLPHVLPASVAVDILRAATKVLAKEPTLLEVHPPDDGHVTVVGDLHGQLHDFYNMLRLSGLPGDKTWYIFNGDFVDRGIWGIELLISLAAWKLASPPGVVSLVRGDHESSSCTAFYGFKKELKEKYGMVHYRKVYRAAKTLFKELPLAARVANVTLVVHGGLWRSPYDVRPDDGPEMTRLLTPGDLADLREATKGGLDPVGYGSSILAADAMWSDPCHMPGMRANKHRGLGTLWGPDVSEQFLRDNKLKLVLRSHESPDGRLTRRLEHGCELPHKREGFSVDHDTPAGKVCTVFSAPDYPMFTDNRNKATVVKLHPETGFIVPTAVTYDAAERPTDRTLPFIADEEEAVDSDIDMYDKTDAQDFKLMRESLIYARRSVQAGMSPAGSAQPSRQGSQVNTAQARDSIKADIARGSLYRQDSLMAKNSGGTKNGAGCCSIS